MPENRGREGGGEGGQECWLCQEGDKCLYCSNAGARERDVSEVKTEGEKQTKKKKTLTDDSTVHRYQTVQQTC